MNYIDFKSSIVTNSNDLSYVAFKFTFGALPALKASFQRRTHKHHESPGLSPGNFILGLGVMRSFPWDLVNSKNYYVIIAQTTWVPLS